MIDKAKTLLSSQAFQGTVIVTVGVFIGNIFGYLVQIYLGRSLTVEDYGIFNVLLSVSVIIGVLNNTFMTSVVKISSDLAAKEKFDTLTQLFWGMSFVSLLVGIFFAVVVFFTRELLAGFLNISNVYILIGFAIFLVVSFIRIPPTGYLQGFLRFRAFSFINVLGGVARLLTVVLAVYLGNGVGGIYVWLGLASVVMYLITTQVLKRNFSSYEKIDVSEHYKKILTFAGPVLIVQLGMILLNNIDIILVKHYFDEFTAGIYSGLVTVAKVFLFAANTVAVVMFPMIASAFSKKENIMRKFKPFLYLQVLVILLGVAIFSVFPELIVRVMFSDIYLPAVQYLPKFVWFMAFYVMLNFMTLFLLAIEKTNVYLLQLPFIILQGILIVLFHNNIDVVIDMNLITSGLLLLGVMIYSAKSANLTVKNLKTVNMLPK